jgi:hypothetical protein
MASEGSDQEKVSQSEVLKQTIISLFDVASTKTSQQYAWTTIKNLLRDLERYYVFLKYVHMKDIQHLTHTIDDITVISKVNMVEPTHLGKAIQHIIDIFKRHLGTKAGYYFMQEFRYSLGELYHTKIRDLGVDLRLAELQEELGELHIGQYKIKDDDATNIAFIEKA